MFKKSSNLKKAVEDFLVTIVNPRNGKNIIDENIISPILIKNNKLIFTVDLTNVNLEQKYFDVEQIKSQCQLIIDKIDKDIKLSVVVTSHSNNPSSEPKLNSKQKIPGVKKIILVASGKGGVGKTTMAFYLAMSLQKLGNKVALLDADIYGPSIPTILGVHDKPILTEDGKMQPIFKYDLYCNSIGFLVDAEAALAWRGAMLNKSISQLIMGTKWHADVDEIDYLIVDMPPGTGDVHLTIAKNYQIGGAVIVTIPQKLSYADVSRAIDFYQKFSIPVIGLIENMAYFEIDDKKHYLYGNENDNQLVKKYNIDLLGSIPIIPEANDYSKNNIINNPVFLHLINIAKKM